MGPPDGHSVIHSFRFALGGFWNSSLRLIRFEWEGWEGWQCFFSSVACECVLVMFFWQTQPGYNSFSLRSWGLRIPLFAIDQTGVREGWPCLFFPTGQSCAQTRAGVMLFQSWAECNAFSLRSWRLPISLFAVDQTDVRGWPCLFTDGRNFGDCVLM